MPRLEYSERFVNDLSRIESKRLESEILGVLDAVEAFGEFGSTRIPNSVKLAFGGGVRKVAVNPFDLIYTLYPERDLARVEALVHQRAVW